MAGFTNAAMRRMCHHFGAALTYTEMVNVNGIMLASDKTWHLLETLPDEGPVMAHLYGTEPELFAAAAARVTALGRFVGIDLNAGCPMRKITCNGAGAALMKQPALIGKIVAAMVQATTLPVTVKTRVGPRPDQVVVQEILHAVEEAGGAALTIHGRFATQEHSGEVHLPLLAEVKRVSRIPIIGNGGILTAADAQQMFQETGVDAVMIARGATGNPWIFQEIAALFGGAAVSDFRKCETVRGGSGRGRLHDLAEIRRVLEMHMASELALHHQIRAHFRLPSHALSPDLAAVATFRCHLFRYLHGLAGSAYVRGQLNHLRTLDDIRAALDGCFEREAQARAHATALAAYDARGMAESFAAGATGEE
jgi:nifR3 family TIM-barrel protein